MRHRRHFQACVHNKRSVSEYNPDHQMSGFSDGSDARSYKHADVLKTSDNMEGQAFYLVSVERHQWDTDGKIVFQSSHAGFRREIKKDSFGCRVRGVYSGERLSEDVWQKGECFVLTDKVFVIKTMNPYIHILFI